MKINSLESSINKINNNMISTDSYIRIMNDTNGCRSIIMENDTLKLDHGGPPSAIVAQVIINGIYKNIKNTI